MIALDKDESPREPNNLSRIILARIAFVQPKPVAKNPLCIIFTLLCALLIMIMVGDVWGVPLTQTVLHRDCYNPY